MRPGILTLTTDFGTHGPYVAALKGVVLGLAPDVTFIDVSHEISPQCILEGAFVLSSIVEAFAPGTVHLGVIDPGVGTARRLIAAKLAEQWFVVPDNGLLSGVARRYPTESVFEIDNPAISLPTISHTFHGRDILAPAAAHLLLGRDPAQLGPARYGVVTLNGIEPRRNGDDIVGEVVFRDSFGNLITNVPGSWLEDRPRDSWLVEVAGQRILGISRTYGEHDPGTLVSLVGSSGWLEVAMVNGDASRFLGVGPGTTVWFRKNG